ncbi:MAG: hypothetical protein ACOC6P_03875 [Candidatus Aminicenantaceae bacterium]
MEELNMLEKMEKVKAPPGFERNIRNQLALRKRKKQKRKYYGLSLAGASGLLFVFIIVLNIFDFPKKTSMEQANLNKEKAISYEQREDYLERDFLPVTEQVDYKEEVRTFINQPRTIYILEQVSNETNSEILY